MTRRRRGPASVCEPVDFGTAELIPDSDRPSGWTLLLNGLPQSHVDLGTPSQLHFEYLRHLGAVADTACSERVLHLGGGALALPRYIAAKHPRSAQLVVEHDAALIALVRRVLPLPTAAQVRIRHADAVDTVTTLPAGRYDLVIADFPELPAAIAGDIARILRPGGVYAANILDGTALNATRLHLFATRAGFDDLCLIADPAVLRGKRPGNVVLAASIDCPLRIEELRRVVAHETQPVRLLHGAELEQLTPQRLRFP